VWCVIPAVKAAIATGMIDSANVGLWVTRGAATRRVPRHADEHLQVGDRRRAAHRHGEHVLISVLEYGRSNQAIFESSQGRFKGNFTDNYEA
jgi:hypothetical protein